MSEDTSRERKRMSSFRCPLRPHYLKLSSYAISMSLSHGWFPTALCLHESNCSNGHESPDSPLTVPAWQGFFLGPVLFNNRPSNSSPGFSDHLSSVVTSPIMSPARIFPPSPRIMPSIARFHPDVLQISQVQHLSKHIPLTSSNSPSTALLFCDCYLSELRHSHLLNELLEQKFKIF